MSTKKRKVDEVAKPTTPKKTKEVVKEKKLKFEYQQSEDGKDLPYIANFATLPNIDELDSENGLKFKLVKSKAGNVLRAKKGTITFQSDVRTGEEAAKYYIGVLNKETGTVKIVECEGISTIYQSVKTTDDNKEDKEEKINNEDYSAKRKKFIDAVKKYGTKNSILAKQAKMEAKFSVNKNNIEEQYLDKMKEKLEEIEEQTEQSVSVPYDIPIPDLNTSIPQEVYNFEKLIEMMPIEDVKEHCSKGIKIQEYFGSRGLDKVYWLAGNTKLIKSMDDNEIGERLLLCYLVYYYQLAILNTSKQIDKVKTKPPIPSDISTSFNKLFTDTGKLKKQSLLDKKLINYICALYLVINNCSVSINLVFDDLKDILGSKWNAKKLQNHFQLLGCTVKAQKEGETFDIKATLTLPLKFDFERKKKRH